MVVIGVVFFFTKNTHWSIFWPQETIISHYLNPSYLANTEKD